MFVTSSRSSVTSALRLTFSFFIFVFISAISVSNLSIVLPTSIILPFSFPKRSFSRHCTSLQNSKSASVLTRCVLICNSRPLFPQVLTLKTPSAYSVLHCPRWIPPNPGSSFTGSSGCVSASSARAVLAQHNAHARRSRKSFQIASLTRGLVFVFFSFSSFVNVVRLPFFIATFAVVFVEVLESISCFLPDLCIAGMTNAHTRKAYKF